MRPYHGVFVYGPAPVYHSSYVGTSEAQVVQEHLPERKIDREGSLAVGLRGGSMIGGYDSAAGFSDLGAGAVARYRPAESVGLEVGLSQFGMKSDDSMRSHTVGSASVELFAWPWTRVSPYVVGGLSFDARNFDDAYFDESTDSVQTFAQNDMQWGPHAGLGVEFAIGKSLAIDLEARYMPFIGTSADDPTLPGNVQTGINVLAHF